MNLQSRTPRLLSFREETTLCRFCMHCGPMLVCRCSTFSISALKSSLSCCKCCKEPNLKEIAGKVSGLLLNTTVKQETKKPKPFLMRIFFYKMIYPVKNLTKLTHTHFVLWTYLNSGHSRIKKCNTVSFNGLF